MLHWLAQFIHPGGSGYWFWSGIGSGSPIIAAGIVALRHANCHQKGCWRLGHPHPDTNHLPVCRKHHPSLNRV